MRNFLARVAYWSSLGFDNSEYPIAGEKSRERKRRLKRRIGAKAFSKFDGSDTGAKHDPASWAAMLIPLFIVAVPGFLIFLLIR